MPFQTQSAVAKMKLDPDQFGVYAEEHEQVLKQLGLKTATVCPAFGGPCGIPCTSSDVPVARRVMVPRAPVGEKRLKAVLMK